MATAEALRKKTWKAGAKAGEKEGSLPLHCENANNTSSGFSSRRSIATGKVLTWQRCLLFLGFVILLIVALLHALLRTGRGLQPGDDGDAPSAALAESAAWCPIADTMPPLIGELADSRDLFAGEAVLTLQVERLSAAVNISTISYDDNGDVDQDTRWSTFGTLYAQLETLFPRMYVLRTIK